MALQPRIHRDHHRDPKSLQNRSVFRRNRRSDKSRVDFNSVLSVYNLNLTSQIWLRFQQNKEHFFQPVTSSLYWINLFKLLSTYFSLFIFHKSTLEFLSCTPPIESYVWTETLFSCSVILLILVERNIWMAYYGVVALLLKVSIHCPLIFCFVASEQYVCC
jgi:hypothetical protein